MLRQSRDGFEKPMNRSPRWHQVLIKIILPVCVLGIPAWWSYRQWRQDALDQALIAAVEENDLRSVLSLLERGADSNARDRQKNARPFWQRIKGWLLGKPHPSDGSHTALWLACFWGKDPESAPDNWMLVKALLDRGAQVEVRDKETGSTPLLTAALLNKTEVCKLLIKSGANVNVTDSLRNTPLIWAASHHNKALVRLFVGKGADVNAVGSFGWGQWTPLFAALNDRDNDPDIIEMLLSRGATVNAPGVPPGWTDLTIAIEWDMPIIVRILLKQGVDINQRTSDGLTPLKLAKEKGNPEIIQLLEHAGARE